MKAAAYLDLDVSRAELKDEQKLPGTDLLNRVVFKLRALRTPTSAAPRPVGGKVRGKAIQAASHL